jgi:hypothetical protein
MAPKSYQFVLEKTSSGTTMVQNYLHPKENPASLRFTLVLKFSGLHPSPSSA